MDTKTNFIATDVDETVLPELEKNYEKATEIWTSKWKYLEKEQELKIAELNHIESIDAKKLSKIKLEDVELGEFSIVTEGFLGQNFSKKPETQKIESSLEKIKIIWETLIQEADKTGIREIVFCLPYYPNFREEYGAKTSKLIPNFIPNLIKNTSYKYEKLGKNTDYILYSRERSNTGHLILKIIRN